MTDNSFRRANSLGTLSSSPIVKRNFVGRRDRLDIFRFDVKSSSNVSLSLTGLRSNADLMVFNSRRTKLMQSVRGGSRNEQMQMALDAGVYYVKVRSRGARGTNYRLTAAAVPRSPSPSNLGNPGSPTNSGIGTFNNPIDLGTLAGGTLSRSREITLRSSPRHYKFRLAEISSTNITLSQVSDSTRMDLYYDFNGNGLADQNEDLVAGFGSSSNSSPISLVLPATGTYFLKVAHNAFQDSSLYDLFIATTPAPGNLPADPGSDAPTAYSLGTLTRGGRIEASDYIGTVDAKDMYRFDVATNSTVNFNIRTTSGNRIGSRVLYQDINNNGLIDSNERVRTLGESESLALEAGTHFLEIDRGFSSSNSAYTVLITA